MVVGVAVLVVVAAGAGALLFYQRQQGRADLSAVPEDVDSVTYLDVDGARTDQAVRATINKLFAMSEAEGTPEDFEAFLEEFEEETDLRLQNLHTVVSYTKYPDPAATSEDQTAYTGTVIRSDWSEKPFVEAYAAQQAGIDTFTESEYEGRTVYKPGGTRPDYATPQWVGVLGKGTYVVGTPEAVKDAIEVALGDLDPVGEELEGAFRETRDGHLRFASRVPSQQVPARPIPIGGGTLDTAPLQDVAFIAGSVYADGQELGTVVRFTADDPEAAKDVRDLVIGARSLASGTADNDDLESALRDIEVNRKGADVIVRFGKDVDVVKQLLEALNEEAGANDARTPEQEVKAGVSIGVESGSVTVNWETNVNADHLEVRFSTPDGDTVTKRIESVGETVAYDGRQDERVEVVVVAVADDGTVSLVARREVDL